MVNKSNKNKSAKENAELKESEELKNFIITLSKKYNKLQKESSELKESVRKIKESLARITKALVNPIHRFPKEEKSTKENNGNSTK